MTTLIFVALGVAVLLAVLWVYQRRLIYFPTHAVPPVGAVLPGAQEVELKTDDGLTLGGWFLPAESATAPAVIVFNGNAGNRAHRAPLAAELSRAGISVLLFDYRGYGGNPGVPTEAGLGADARAARAWLARRAKRIVYFGESLGSAVAVDLAVEHPPAALILRSPFTSLADMGRLHYPYLPVRLLLRDRYISIDRIADVRSTLLVIAGERDSIVPASHSRRLFEAAREPKRFVVIPGADHNDLEMLTGDRLMREVIGFVRSA